MTPIAQTGGSARRWAGLLLPAALVALGLGARGAAARAFTSFTEYRSPYAFAATAQVPGPALAPRVVMVVLDGLGLPASRHMPFLNSLRAQGASFDCRIGLPSLSLPARAVLMTGAWQEVHGQTTNYNARPLELEHVFRLARARGLATALAAGPNAQKLFAPYVAHSAVYLEGPETAPFADYERALGRDVAAAAALLDGGPGLTVLDLNMVDEAGHGWGSRSAEYARAAALVDEGLRALVSRLDLRRDALLVTADHGHVAGGGHGGPEPEVMEVPLVMAGRGVRRGVSGACAQVDVAPTLAVLLGLPLPGASQGSPLLEALDAPAPVRAQALRNAVAQRAAFVRDYAALLQGLDVDGSGAARAMPVALRADAAAQADTEAPAGDGAGGEEAALSARLRSLAGAEARLKLERLAREAPGRWRRALLLGALPLVLLAALGTLRVFTWPEAGWAAAFGLGGVAAYHLLLPLVGLGYSLTAVNKDEWLQAFFRKDMALGALACALATGALCALRRRRGAGLFELCRLSWLVAAAFCAALVLEVAFVYARHDVFLRWAMPDQVWSMAFYLDMLAVMAAGVSAALALPAGLSLLVPMARQQGGHAA